MELVKFTSLYSLVNYIRKTFESEYQGVSEGINQLKAAFNNVDSNGDGRLSKMELREALSSMRVELTPEEVDKIFVKFDTDQSGFLDYKVINQPVWKLSWHVILLNLMLTIFIYVITLGIFGLDRLCFSSSLSRIQGGCLQ